MLRIVFEHCEGVFNVSSESVETFVKVASANELILPLQLIGSQAQQVCDKGSE